MTYTVLSQGTMLHSSVIFVTGTLNKEYNIWPVEHFYRRSYVTVTNSSNQYSLPGLYERRTKEFLCYSLQRRMFCEPTNVPILIKRNCAVTLITEKSLIFNRNAGFRNRTHESDCLSERNLIEFNIRYDLKRDFFFFCRP